MSDTNIEALKIALEALRNISDFDAYEPAGPAANTAQEAIDKITALSPPSVSVNVQSERHVELVNAAEQFIAAYADGNAGTMLDYFEDIFKESLAALPPASQPVVCEDCGDACTAHNPGVCGTCYAMKYRDVLPPAVQVPDVDWLSNVIRTVDGNHKLGAGALAEKIVEAMLAAPSPSSQGGSK